MTIPIKRIKPKRISDQVFDQIRELIYRGTLKPGEKLMTERELSQATGVSRTTVRDAIQRLAAVGLVVQKQGKGTYIRKIDGNFENPFAQAIEAQNPSLKDLLEVRMGLECNATAMAAKRADESDIKALDQSIDEMRMEIESGRLGTQADTAFHMAIAYAAKNPLHILIMRNFHNYLFHNIRENLSCLYKDPGNIKEIFKQHMDILTSIKARKSKKAYMAMHRHIQYLMDYFEPNPEDL
ncbi:FadR/GntR family transcriptional regulator [Desulfospira joergensenii]|uniref:FadR/GntR family transcriptional regulator n=1 Tax=Desulfospira joergensenii TaxID=53329 RepID=UPI0003B544BF|nr:FadR/GntR family transcriptional regulator [Desulfospira joergensenii]